MPSPCLRLRVSVLRLSTPPKYTQFTQEAQRSKGFCNGRHGRQLKSSNTHKDQDTTEIEEEDWIEYMKRSTNDATEKMEIAKIRCWNKTHTKMRWRLPLRIATSPSERWLMKAAEWNPELSSKYRTNRAIGRPRKRWEDDINEFLEPVQDETENFIESSGQINKTWINTAKDRGRWTLLEDKYTMTAED